MSLGSSTINTWDEMKQLLLAKYKYYCRGTDRHGDDIFRMTQTEDESLEDYLERFLFSVKKSKHSTLNEDSLKLIFLRGISDECIDCLDLMGGGDITQSTWAEIGQICKKYSRSTSKKNKKFKPGAPLSASGTRVSRLELSLLLKDFKEDIINNMATQLDTLVAKKKHEEADAFLAEFYPHYK
ncbi:hypothetical protein SUGI_0429720 [Cryptomeria japonica]|nr:hypothetical protein SUGI_0429720 [Cryptomeria japonica]